MFGSSLLEVLIGLVLVYFLLAVLVSTFNEFLAGAIDWRARNLEVGLRNLLDGVLGPDPDPRRSNQPLLTLFYEHPLIKSLYTRRFFMAGTDPGRKPAYIPAHLFVTALEDLLLPADRLTGPRSIESLREAVAKLPPSDAKTTLESLLGQAGTKLELAREAVEQWFDDAMDRLSGWYRRQVQVVIFGISLGLALALNADTLTIAQTLIHSPETRAYIVAFAEEVAKQSPPPAASPSPGASPAPGLEPSLAKVRQVTEQLDRLELPLGWPKGWTSVQEAFAGWDSFLPKLFGLLLTAAAVTLGAPFWFDLLGKVVSLRSAIKPPKAEEEPAR